jgi:hypothetical protein
MFQVTQPETSRIPLFFEEIERIWIGYSLAQTLSLLAKQRSVDMKKILILIAALMAASALAALIRAQRKSDSSEGDPYDDSTMDYLGV